MAAVRGQEVRPCVQRLPRGRQSVCRELAERGSEVDVERERAGADDRLVHEPDAPCGVVAVRVEQVRSGELGDLGHQPIEIGGLFRCGNHQKREAVDIQSLDRDRQVFALGVGAKALQREVGRDLGIRLGLRRAQHELTFQLEPVFGPLVAGHAPRQHGRRDVPGRGWCVEIGRCPLRDLPVVEGDESGEGIR